MSGGFRLGRAAPLVPVADIERALTFYRDVWGLRVVFSAGEPVSFCVLSRDGAEIHIQRSDAAGKMKENILHLMVSDVEAAYAHLTANGAPMIRPLEDTSHGLRSFVVADPDGNTLDVAQAPD